MKATIGTLIVLVLVSALVGGVSSQELEWVDQFGSMLTTPIDWANAVDANGDVYVVGATGGTFPGQVFLGIYDAFVRKYDGDGNELWTRQFGSSTGYDRAHSVCVGPSGNCIYVAGGGGFIEYPGPGGGNDAFVRKYDTDGNEIWTNRFGTDDWDEGLDVSVDPDGECLYLVGTTMGAFPGYENVRNSDAFVCKLSTVDGTLLWTRQFEFSSTSEEEVAGVVVNADHEVYVAGDSYAPYPDIRSRHTFLCKFDAQGEELWTQEESDPHGMASGLSIDTSGDIYLVGWRYLWKHDSDGNRIWIRELQPTCCDPPSCTGVSVAGDAIYVAGSTPPPPGELGSDAFVGKYDLDGNELWTREFGSAANTRDGVCGVSADPHGNVYVVGETNGTLPGQTPSGGEDAFIRKYDASGSELWTRQFTSIWPGSDCASAIDANGNLYLAGYTTSSLSGQPSCGITDAFVRKYDSSREEEWTVQFGMSNWHTLATAISVEPSRLYVAGKFYGRLAPGEPTQWHAFICAFDANGNRLWTRQFGTSAVDSITGTYADASNNCVYVVGTTKGALDGQTSHGGIDAFVRKYDAEGNELWTHQFGTAGENAASAICGDAGGAYITGWTRAPLPGQTHTGESDAFVRKYDFDGNELWTRQFGTVQGDFASGIAVSSTGVYLVGYTNGRFQDQSRAGQLDGFISVFSTDGNESWTRQFGTAGHDYPTGVDIGPNGVYIAGYTEGAFPGQSALGRQDAFVKEYDVQGNEGWTYQFGTDNWDRIHGISVGQTGLYVAGLTAGALPGQTYTGIYDAFVAKIGPINSPPTVEAGGPYTANEGGSVELSATGDDPEGGPLAYDWDLDNDGVFETLGQEPSFSAASLDGPTSHEVAVRVTDDGGLSATDGATVEVLNVPPILSEITTPVDPVHIDAGVSPTATFDDPGILDTHIGEWDWGDDTDPSDAIIDEAEGSGTATGSHAYSDPGVYTVTLTLTDDDGGSDQSVSQFLVIYDPTAGYVTGGGWINSPEGAYVADPSLTGRASFGFVSRYKKGATVPSGNTMFHFYVADLKFSSTEYQWLVVAGPKAQYKGSGTINGDGDYGFMLSAIDGEIPGGGDVDKFRIKIWDKASEEVVYDNQMGEPENGDPVLAIGGGNIAIHDGTGGGVQAYRHRALRPVAFGLDQNFPNPFTGETTVRFSLADARHTTLTVHDVTGRAVQILVNKEFAPGVHCINWKADVPAGTYFCRMQAGEFTATKRMTVVR